MDRGHVSLSPWVQIQECRGQTSRVTELARGPQDCEVPSARSLHVDPCLFAQRAGGHALQWSNYWPRSTQMSGSGWQTPV